MKRAPKKPPTCTAMVPSTWSWAPWRRQCANPRRSAEVLAGELRDYGPLWRSFAYGSESTPTEIRQRELNQVSYALDEDLTALGLELSRKLCKWCAEEQALAFLSTRKLVFVGILASFIASGRDERAEEEFELARCAA